MVVQLLELLPCRKKILVLIPDLSAWSLHFPDIAHESSLWVLWLVPIAQIYKLNGLSNKCVFMFVCPVPLGYHVMD